MSCKISTAPINLLSSNKTACGTKCNLFYNYENQTKRSNINFRFGFDYFLNHNLTLTSEFKISNHEKIDSAIQTFTVPEYPSDISVDEEGKDRPNFDLEYLFILEKEFKVPDQELKFSIALDEAEDNEISTLIDPYDSANNKKTEYIDFDNGAEIDFSYKAPFLSNIIKNYIMKTYDQKFEFGYDSRIINNKNMMNFDTNILMGDNFYIDTTATNTFQFKRNIYALFAEYENQITEKIMGYPSD